MARNPNSPIGREADDKLKEMQKVQGGCVSFLRQRQKGGVARSFQKLYFFFSSFVLVFCIICIWIRKSREAVCVSFQRERQKEGVARLSHKFKQHCVAIGANDWVSVESRILHKSCCVYNVFVLKPQCRCNPSTFFCSAKLLQKSRQLVTEVPPWNIDCALCISLVACSSCKTFALKQIRNPSDKKC